MLKNAIIELKILVDERIRQFFRQFKLSGAAFFFVWDWSACGGPVLFTPTDCFLGHPHPVEQGVSTTIEGEALIRPGCFQGFVKRVVRRKFLVKFYKYSIFRSKFYGKWKRANWRL